MSPWELGEYNEIQDRPTRPFANVIGGIAVVSVRVVISQGTLCRWAAAKFCRLRPPRRYAEPMLGQVSVILRSVTVQDASNFTTRKGRGVHVRVGSTRANCL